MPIYEYRCSDCSREFEKIIWNLENEGIKCPFCNGEKVLRLLSIFSKAGGSSGEVSQPSTCSSSSSGFS